MKKIKITKKHIKDFLTINLGVFLMAMAYSILIDRNKLVIGGVGGIATILSNAITGLKINSSFIILIINVVLLLIALIFVGKKFFLKTLYTSLIYPVYVLKDSKLYEMYENKEYTPLSVDDAIERVYYILKESFIFYLNDSCYLKSIFNK